MSTLIFLLTGCGTAPADTASPPVWTPPAPADPVPEWSAEEVGQRLQERFDAGLPGCMTLVDAFTEAWAMGDEACPGDPSFFEDLKGCTATSGYWFTGIAQHSQEEFTEQGITTSFVNMVSGFEVQDDQGRSFHSGGGCGITQQGEADDYTIDAWYNGSAESAWAEGWLAEGISLLLYVSLTPTTANLSGGVSVGEHTLSFSRFRWGGACADGPDGMVKIRGEQPYWYTLNFGTDCDQCGELTHHTSTALGTVCLDVAPLLDSLRSSYAITQ